LPVYKTVIPMKATKENNTIVASTLLGDVAWYSIELGVLSAQIEEARNEIIATMTKFKALGFIAIQDGRRKNSTPKTGEFSYNAFAEISEQSFIAKKKAITETKGMTFVEPTKTQIENFTKQFVQSVACYLEHGIWVNNCGRDKQTALIAAGIIKAPKEPKKEGSKGTRKPADFNAKKIADMLCLKYTDSQLDAIIVEIKAMM
jgi:hypothetical protein